MPSAASASVLSMKSPQVRKAFLAATSRLPPMPTIRDLIKLYKLSAIKQLSQNFLLDEKLTARIVKAAGSVEDHYVCEVGPGPGGITRPIISRGAKKVILIEKDKRFKPSLDLLSEYVPGVVEAHYGDVLSFKMDNLFPPSYSNQWEDHPPKIRIIGNLPFSISTPLLIRWLKDISTRENAWRFGRVSLTLTFQKEVAQRLVAPEGSPQRCRLSVMAQNLCHISHKFDIKGSAFVPKPDVDVGVVKFTPKIIPQISQPFELIEKVVRQTFSNRQKFCYSPIRSLFPELIRNELAEYMLSHAQVSRENRPYKLTMEEFDRLCNSYAHICNMYPYLRDYNYRGHRADELWNNSYSGNVDKILLDMKNLGVVVPKGPKLIDDLEKKENVKDEEYDEDFSDLKS